MGKLFMYAQRIARWRHFPLVTSLVLITAFMLGFYWRDMVRGAMCTGAEDEHCTREWISALGGWIAIIFAYLTIRTMTRQTEDANRHQRENIELQMFDKLSVAWRIIAKSSMASMDCDGLARHIAQRVEDNNLRDIHQLRDRVEHIRGPLSAEELSMFEYEAPLTRYEPMNAFKRALREISDLEYNISAGHNAIAITNLQCLKTEIVLAKAGLDMTVANCLKFTTRWRSRAGMI